MVTPFYPDGSVNYRSAARLAEYLVSHGSDGLVVAGSTGESATLSSEEKLKLFTTVLDAVGDKAAVIAGTGSNDTRSSVSLTVAAEKLGVHGSMLVGPYYNKPCQEGYFRHFKTIAAATKLPIILYNVPGRTASNITAITVAELADECPNLAAVKEASGNLEQVSDIIRSVRPGFLVYSGNDMLTLPIMALGGNGVISVAGHVVGREMQQMMEAFVSGDIRAASEIHLRLVPFFKVIFITTNPIPIKTAVNLLGLDAGPLRLPLVEANAGELERLRKTMTDLGVLA